MNAYGKTMDVPLQNLHPYRNRPFTGSDECIEQLVANCRDSGMLYPLMVRPSSADDHYEVIIGNRRLLVAERLGLTAVPVMTCTLSDSEAMLLNDSDNA